MGRSILTGIAVLGALALAACGGSSSTGGTGGAGQGTGGAGSCGGTKWSQTNDACNACMESSCCDKLAACDPSTSCGKLVACLAACAPGSSACTQSCESAQPDGASDLQALVSCYDASCKTGGACGTNVCGTGIVVPSATCGNCLTKSCCDSWTQCSKDATCVDCLAGTQANGCDNSALYTSAKACLETICGDVCTQTICDTTLGTGIPACNQCLGQSDAKGGCCEEAEACAADAACKACITGESTSGCDANAAYQSFNACTGKCATQCSG
jgi:hypothetical protein